MVFNDRMHGYYRNKIIKLLRARQKYFTLCYDMRSESRLCV